jgi:hypothetical protein
LGFVPDRELQREQVWSRIHLVPLLVAEGDRDAYRRQQAALQREREIMKDVKGWEVSLMTKYDRIKSDQSYFLDTPPVFYDQSLKLSLVKVSITMHDIVPQNRL